MDGGNPRLSSTAVVAVTVRRNLVAPVFRQNRYDTTIPETQAPGSLIMTIQADDADITVSFCRILKVPIQNCIIKLYSISTDCLEDETDWLEDI